jgi:hypothetical protein
MEEELIEQALTRPRFVANRVWSFAVRETCDEFASAIARLRLRRAKCAALTTSSCHPAFHSFLNQSRITFSAGLPSGV